jgi:hypothetical protein
VVIEDSMNGSDGSYSCPLAYFYCSRNVAEPDRSDATQILRCIARQLSSSSPDRPLSPATVELYRKSVGLGTAMRMKLTLEEYRNLIIELIEGYPLTTIVVDALDECGLETRGELMEALETILTRSISLVKVFITSREEGDLRFSLQNHANIQVTTAENGSDIQKFVNFETDKLVLKNQLLASIRIKSAKDELKALIKADVITKADGM